MGGKLWSKDEEEVFWLQLIPHSPKRIGDDRVKNKEHSWYWFADQMTQIMAHNARREYTPLCVCEYFHACNTSTTNQRQYYKSKTILTIASRALLPERVPGPLLFQGRQAPPQVLEAWYVANSIHLCKQTAC